MTDQPEPNAEPKLLSKHADRPGTNPAHIRNDAPANFMPANPSDFDVEEPEAPLLSLLDKDMENMTTDELRNHVQSLRQHAGSGATLNAAVKSKKKKTAKKKVAKKKTARKKTAILQDDATQPDLFDASKYTDI